MVFGNSFENLKFTNIENIFSMMVQLSCHAGKSFDHGFDVIRRNTGQFIGVPDFVA